LQLYVVNPYAYNSSSLTGGSTLAGYVMRLVALVMNEEAESNGTISEVLVNTTSSQCRTLYCKYCSQLMYYSQNVTVTVNPTNYNNDSYGTSVCFNESAQPLTYNVVSGTPN
jgi:hypothetical protein